ncbi:MAG: PAS domain-containing protein, partial [Eubacteriales bacterium]|nr:PAS domain-containing protein [Eubacteriales bacterium]
MNGALLIVNGSAAERAALSNLLQEEYDIFTAANGEEAISILTEYANIISAVILDIGQGGAKEEAALEQIRKDARFSQLPIIALAGLSAQEQREHALRLGANGFVAKPYRPELLLYAVRNAVELRQSAAEDRSIWNDRLTGLLNRDAFLAETERLIKAQTPGYYVLSCMDVENFKVVNDQYGTGKGDEVLREIAETISSLITVIDGIACRVMADKFAILYAAKWKDSRELLECYTKTIAPKCINRNVRIRVGRYMVNDLSLPVGAMLDRATLAEESIKDRFDTYIAEYNDSMRENLLHEQKIINEMVDALNQGEFEPWFQPQYNHVTGAIIGAEALVRWRRNGKLVPPYSFIPIFERNGFIYKLDQFMWRRVCIELRRWLDEGLSPLPISVNISRYDIYQKDFFSVICGLVKEYRLPVDLLRLEVTESAFAESSKMIVHTVNQLIHYGFTVEIDDFGSGYSSLNTLKDVPASILKLGMKFFENTENSQRSGNIIESVVRMARWLGMAVIAEGVEDRAQAEYLRSIGCFYIQGYYYAKPMPLTEYEALWKASEKEPHLSRLKTVDTWDNSAFWDPKSMETLIFNSYVGGACIFEYHGGKTELLRVNPQYARELGQLIPDNAMLSDQSAVQYLDDENRDILFGNIKNAIKTRHESSCELKLSDGGSPAHVEYVRTTLRVIARTGERFLFYCVVLNMTKQRVAEEKRRSAEKKETESAQQLQVIMGNINGGVSAILVDDNGKSRMVFNNEKYFELYGYTQEQAIAEQLDVMTLILPEDLPRVLESIKQLKRDRMPAIIDYRCKRRDGDLAYLRANASLMQIEGYGNDVITSVVTDISEQKRLSDQLRAVVDNINGGVMVTRLAEGKPEFIIVNNRFYEILGYTKEQYEKECTDKFMQLHPEDRERATRQFIESARSDKQFSMEYRIIRRDGEVRYIQSNISVMRLFGVEGPVQIAVANDVTELRMAENREKEAAEKLSTVLNHVGSGITAVVMREAGLEILFANNKYFEILGYTRAEYRERTASDWLAVIHPEDRESVRERIRQVNRTQGDISLVYRALRGDGTVIWIKNVITVTNLTGIDAPVQVSVFSDITAEKESDAQLRFLNDSAHDILARQDSEQAIRDTLHKLILYFAGDRAYVVETDDQNAVTNNTYEICAEGVSSEKENLQQVPFADTALWLETLNRNESIVIEQVEKMEDGQAVKRMLLAQNIHSIVVAPLWRNGKLIGFVGVDNPRQAMNQLERLMALGDYIAILLTRRDLNNKIMHDYAVMETLLEEQKRSKEQQKQILDNLPCGTALYEYRNGKLSVVHINKQYWQLVERAPVDYSRESVFDAICPEDRQMLHQEIEAAIRQKRNAMCDVRILCGNGEYKPFHIVANILPEEQEAYSCYVFYMPISNKAMSVQEMLPIALSTMMSSSDDLSFVKDKDLCYLCCSRSVAEALGLDNEREIIGKTDYDLFEPARADRFREADRSVLETGNALVNTTEVIRHKDGTAHYIKTSKYPLLDADGTVIGLYGNSRDITKARETEFQLKLLTDSIPGGIASFEVRDGRLRPLYFNEGFFSFSGYTREEYRRMIENDPYALVLQEDQQKLRAAVDIFIANEGQTALEECIYRSKTKSGGIRWFSMKGSAMDISGGRLVLSVVQYDVTEQQEAQEKLRVSEEENRLAIAHSGNIITKFNVRERTLSLPATLNPIFALPPVLHHMPEEQIALGRVSPETAAAYTELFESIVRGSASGTTTFQQHSTKGWRWLEAQYTTVFSNNGRPVSAVITFVDVTKQLETEVVYNKWQQSLDERPHDSYTLFRCNLSKKASFDSWEGSLLQVRFDPEKATFEERTQEYVEQCVFEEDRAVYKAFMNADALLANYDRGHRSDTLEYREQMPDGSVRWLRLSVDLVE